MSTLPKIRETIIDFVNKHPAQFTITRLAIEIAVETEYGKAELEPEIRSMMGTDLELTASRTVMPGAGRPDPQTNKPGSDSPSLEDNRTASGAQKVFVLPDDLANEVQSTARWYSRTPQQVVEDALRKCSGTELYGC